MSIFDSWTEINWKDVSCKMLSGLISSCLDFMPFDVSVPRNPTLIQQNGFLNMQIKLFFNLQIFLFA